MDRDCLFTCVLERNILSHLFTYLCFAGTRNFSGQKLHSTAIKFQCKKSKMDSNKAAH